MDLYGNPDLPARALRLAQMLVVLAQNNPKGTLDGMLTEDTSAPVQSYVGAATALVPTWYAAKSGSLSIVLIAGCTQLTHATAVIENYSGGYLDSLTNPVSNLWPYCTGQIVPAISALGLDTGAYTVLAGHSFGGCVARQMYGERITAQGAVNTMLLTFGEPKFGNRAQILPFQHSNSARWFCSDDPVPLVPPTTDDSIAVALVFSLRELTRFGRFLQPAGGVELYSDGTILNGVLPHDATISAVASLAGWLLAIDGSSSSGHHMATYVSRLSQWILNNPTVQQPPAAGGVAQREITDQRRLITTAEQRAFTQLQQVAEIQNAVPVSIPPAQLFAVVKLGRTFVVRFGDTNVSVSPSRKGAHQLARTWNAALRSLQHQPLVETEDLIQQLRAYTDVAADPDSGIRPTLNTHLPGT